jgi:hypothetical protein
VLRGAQHCMEPAIVLQMHISSACAHLPSRPIWIDINANGGGPRMRAEVVAVALILGGCAFTHDTVQVGPNRYQTMADAAPLRGGAAGAQRMATERATAACAAKGLQINVRSVETGHEYPAAGTATVTFECLRP